MWSAGSITPFAICNFTGGLSVVLLMLLASAKAFDIIEVSAPWSMYILALQVDPFMRPYSIGLMSFVVFCWVCAVGYGCGGGISDSMLATSNTIQFL